MQFFNVRVYGLLMHEGSILTVEEPVWGEQVLKFPGGGLEFGEGLLDCLKREFKEELNCQITDIRHFYTTDFFVQSLINPEHQVISVYYLVKARMSELEYELEDNLQFRWIPMEDLHEDMFFLPIDKHVVKLLHADGSGTIDQYHYFPL